MTFGRHIAILMVLVLANGTGPQHFDQSQGILAVRKEDADTKSQYPYQSLYLESIY